MIRRIFLKSLVVLLVSLLGMLTTASGASDYPNRTIEVINSFSPGGGYDIVFAPFKDRVGKVLGQQLTTVYKPGGGGTIGHQFAANAKPDGYTLLFSSSGVHIWFPHLRDNTGYTFDSFEPVVRLAKITLSFIAKDGIYKDMREFVQAAKTKKMKYGSTGVLSTTHIIMEALGKVAGFEAIHVPYSGAGPALTACLGGHVDMVILGGSPGGLVRPGMLKILAVSSDKRFDAFPDVPTLLELGYNVQYDAYYYILAPKKTPIERTDKIYSAFKKVVTDERAKISDELMNGGFVLALGTPQDLWKTLEMEDSNIVKTLKELNIAVK